MENFYWKVSTFSYPTKCRFEAELMDHLMIGILRPEKQLFLSIVVLSISNQ